MNGNKSMGSRSFVLASRPRIVSSASAVGPVEGEGPLAEEFDLAIEDDTFGLESWEKAESKLFRTAVETSLKKIGKSSVDLSCLIGGDLLDQIISSGFAARELRAPFIGLYSACSTITEALMLAAMLTDAGFLDLTACAASSHFSSVERQFRFPLEMGTQPVPTAQRTVTAAGSMIAASNRAYESILKHKGARENAFKNVSVTRTTIGKVVDYGVKDAGNMGAAMAPAAADTICAHFSDFGCGSGEYDLIVTGDLGVFGSQMLYELLKKRGIDIESRHVDCGKLIFSEKQAPQCGASGCGCAASVIASHFLPLIERGRYSRVLMLATGALLSPLSGMQGESIPAIAHAVVMEHTGN